MADAAFVIQKHDATSLHYDFRLEVEGVMRSWAVPKGLSTDPRDKRLAMEVEDHPLAWNDFEGVIRSGYGKGTVIVWDRGTYRNLNDVPMAEALARGHASFWLEGEKLRGGWSLRRTHAGRSRSGCWSRGATRRPTPGAARPAPSRSRWSAG